MAALQEGRCGAPFDFLGIHPLSDDGSPGRVVRAFVPWARAASVVRTGAEGAIATRMRRVSEGGLFELTLPGEADFFHYLLRLEDRDGREWTVEDPYRFSPALDEGRVAAFLDGSERRVHEILGARPTEVEGVIGTLFAVWAPNARAVGVMGDLNGWDGRCHPMRPRGASGVWELFVPGVEAGSRYKYRVLTAEGGFVEKADPCGRAVELRPATASEVWDPAGYVWSDDEWMSGRAREQADDRPMSVYEVHLGSWRRRPNAPEPGWLTYRELAAELLPYVAEMGFTHIELLPVLEHPLDQSWGYQPLGFFAPTSRFGSPDDFRYFVDRAHQLGLGILLDWVPGHFPEDAHGLARFDGTALYEDPNPLQARHPDWGTLVFDFGKPQVRSFLVSSALHWLEEYHLDGLRVDAVASMLYLDYSRPPGQWTPNEHGGHENLNAVAFLRELSDAVHDASPGTLLIAEESTSWPRVSHGTDRDGLGFDRKWNMGWMNDTLSVFETDPLYRKYVYDRLTFSLLYAFSERFVLPLSHDEVVHGKGSLLGKMPGGHEQRLANLRVLYAYLWTHPGKKLLFMGGEFGQWTEWDSDSTLDWVLLEHPAHAGIRLLLGDLNRLYREKRALHEGDFAPEGFEWLDCYDEAHTTLSFVRWSRGWSESVVVAANFTPVYRTDFRVPVPHAGSYRVLLNSDAPEYGGSGALVPERVETVAQPTGGRAHRLDIPLPGLSVLLLERVGD